MFKGSEPSKFIHLAYLTGILPIKKIKTQSALNNFDEFTMIDSSVLAPFIGFTEDEVKSLCARYRMDFRELKRWYDGYILEEYRVYNPKAVVNALTRRKFRSYWSETGTYEAIVPLINMNFDGLRTAVIEMLSGASVKVQVKSFQNDMVSFANRDDVLTYLIHLGYLGYEQYGKTAFIPNEEIRQELTVALDRNCEAVSEKIEKIHMEYASVIQYNDENSLSSVLAIGYLSAMQYYYKPVREMPSGRGFADFVLIPKREYAHDYPALLVELKWNANAQTAMRQMKEKKYPVSLEDYTGDILLVGINYDKKSKEHQCLIEKYEKK